MNESAKMLREISIIDFTLVDLMLYLDAHPHDRNAMEYFNHYSRIKKQLSTEFSQRFYPLTKDYSDCDKEWKWGNAPLPWEGVCS